MDVSLFGRRFLFSFLLLFSLTACGNRFDLGKEHGRQARIDEANAFLSQGNCGAALEAINPLYGSPYVNDEVRVIESSAYACLGGFQMLTMIGNIAGATNYFSGMVKSVPFGGRQTAFYTASDVITQGTNKLQASSRTTRENTYMVFLQMGVIANLLRTYGGPDSNGNKTSALVYTTVGNPPGRMADADACSLVAGLSIMVDSFFGSSLNDKDTTAAFNKANAVCVSAGYPSCLNLNKNRALCDGSNANSVVAAAVVSAFNAYW